MMYLIRIYRYLVAHGVLPLAALMPVLVIVLVTAIAPVTAQAQTQTYFMLIGSNGYPPFVIIDTTDDTAGEQPPVVSGIVPDVLDLFEAEHPDFKREYRKMPRKRANISMAQGKDIDLMFQSPLFTPNSVMRHYKFTDVLFQTRDVVITLRNQGIDYEGPDDLLDRKVAAIQGYKYAEFDRYFETGIIKDQRVKLHTQAIRLLQKKRVDAYFGNMHVSPWYMKQLNLNPDDFVLSGEALFEFDLGLLVNRNKPELLKQLNEFIDVIKSNGALDEIVLKYIQ